MKNLKIIIAAFLCLVFVLPWFIACGKDEAKPDDKIPAADDNSIVGSDIAKEEKDPDAPDLPDVDMGGKVFTVLGYTGWGGEEIEADIAAGELTGDPIGDAAFNRKIKIEQQYNCRIRVINAEDHEKAVERLRTAVLAGDDTYDCAITACTNFASLLMGDYLMDWKNLSYVDMDKPYWDKNFYESMSILGRNFAASGDVTKRRLQCVWIMAFNKKMIGDNQFESPYDLVKNGQWTYDKMHEMAKKVAKDLNGDGKMTLEDDMWGLNYNGDTIMGIINCSGVKIAEINENGIPELTIGTEVNVEKLMKIFDTMRDHTYSIDTLFKVGGGVTSYANTDILADGRCLFAAIPSHNVTELRAMEVDFGIIPYPKWNEAQDNYTPYTVGSYHPVLSVPKTNDDLDNTGIILEAMSYEGMKTLVPAFYESLLKTKTARDEESAEMIDFIFGNLSYDIGNMYNFGGILGEFGYNMSTNMRANIVSTIEKGSGKWQKAIDSMIAEIENSN